jgi:hypothetical protein
VSADEFTNKKSATRDTRKVVNDVNQKEKEAKNNSAFGRQ